MKKILFFSILTILIITGVFIVRFKLSSKNAIIKPEMTIREPAFADQFYPANPAELSNQINKYLSNSASIINNSESINVLIVPHAGYSYSGSVAASGYKQLENQNINKVILLGPSHQSFFQGFVVDNRDVWETPLGQVKIDQKLADRICRDNKNINCNSQPHNQEHSLEVQLPFLQTVLKDFKIVPILIGQTDNQAIEQLSNIIFDNLTSNTLILVSSDLSHYPNYEIAQQVDHQTIETILSNNPQKFSQKINDSMNQGYPNLQTCACGQAAINAALYITQNLDGQWQKIKYANSGDATGDKSRVVGYASMVFLSSTQNQDKLVEQSSNQENNQLTADQKAKLLDIARKTLENYLTTNEKPSFDINDPDLNSNYGVFVTLNKNGNLRGCMGNFKPSTPLWQTVQDQAIIAATKDPRFPPVKLNELKDLEIEISVLSTPEKINDWKEIELGKHGVIVRNGNRSGTYLPQVGSEHNWKDKEEFLSHLCAYKAGLNSNCYLDKDTDLLIYTADVFSE